MDDTVEIMVYLGVGILFIGILTVFIYQWNIKDDVDVITEIYNGTEGAPKIRVDLVEFVKEARDYWDACGHNHSDETEIFNVYNTEKKPEGILSKEYMFTEYKRLGWCKSIQSANLSCGYREDVNMTDISLPALVKLRCENSTLFIR